MKRILPCIALLLAVVAAGCSDTSGPDGVATVTVAPATVTLAPGVTLPLTATTLDASGRVLTGRVVAWSTSNSAIAQVDASTGVVTTFAPGQVTITAASEGQSGSAVLTVAFPVATVTVAPAFALVATGATQALVATLRDASGNVLTGRTVVWSTSSAGIATVDASGVVTGVATGNATITATSEGRSGTASINVVPPIASLTVEPANPTVIVGATLQLNAVARDAGGNVLTGRSVVWSSSNLAAATVNAAGVVSGVAPGTSTLTATVEGRAASTTVTVSLQTVAGYGLASYGVGQSPRFVATGDLNGDGRIDLVTANNGGANVTILYRNAANTGFDGPVSYPVPATGTLGSVPIFVALGDLNGDARPDIVALDNAGNAVSVLYRNAANTGFDAAVSYALGGSGPTAAAIGDLTGDRRPDLAVAAYFFIGWTKVVVLEHDAAPTGFGAAKSYEAGRRPVAVAIGDLNGDGRNDVVVDGGVVLYRDAANTGFDAPVATGGGVGTYAALADLNGDGQIDITYAGSSGAAGVAYRNAANTGFDIASYSLGSQVGAATSMAVGDLNGDGRLDLAVGTGGAGVDVGGVGILHRNAANTGYDAAVTIPIGTNANAGHAVAAGDFNGDGRLDLVVTDLTSNAVVVLYKQP
jgi:uncharacterized protein YjdB